MSHCLDRLSLNVKYDRHSLNSTMFTYGTMSIGFPQLGYQPNDIIPEEQVSIFIDICLADDEEALSSFLGNFTFTNPRLPQYYGKLSSSPMVNPTKILSSAPHLLSVAAFLGAEECFKLLVNWDMSSLQSTDLRGRYPIHFAVAGGNRNIVRSLFDEYNCSCEVTDEKKETPMHYAAKFGRLELMQFMFTKKIKLLAANSTGKHPIHFACSYGHLEVVKFLLENKEKLGICDRKRRTPLHYAAIGGHTDVLEFLISKGALAIQGSRLKPMDLAIENGNLGCIKSLVAHGLTITQESPIYRAAERGYADIIVYLHSQGFSLDSGLKNDIPITVAVRNGHRNAVKALVQCGASVTMKGSGNQNAIAIAISIGNLSMIKTMIKIVGSLEPFRKHARHHNLVEAAINEGDIDFLRSLNKANFPLFSPNDQDFQCVSMASDPKIFNFLIDEGILQKKKIADKMLATMIELNNRDTFDRLIDIGIVQIMNSKRTYTLTISAFLKHDRPFMLQELYNHGLDFSKASELATAVYSLKSHTSYSQLIATALKSKSWAIIADHIVEGGKVQAVDIEVQNYDYINFFISKKVQFVFSNNSQIEYFLFNAYPSVTRLQFLLDYTKIDTKSINANILCHIKRDCKVPSQQELIEFLDFAKTNNLLHPIETRSSLLTNLILQIFNNKYTNIIENLSEYNLDGTSAFEFYLQRIHQTDTTILPTLVLFLKSNKLKYPQANLIFPAIASKVDDIVQGLLDANINLKDVYTHYQGKKHSPYSYAKALMADDIAKKLIKYEPSQKCEGVHHWSAFPSFSHPFPYNK